MSNPVSKPWRLARLEARVGGYDSEMAEKIWTAQELERMTPAEQDAIFNASVVRDLDDAPAEFLARVRSRFEQHLAHTESPDQ